MDIKRYFTAFSKQGGNVTGLGPDYVPGSWLERTLLALQFRQEPRDTFPVNSGAYPS